MSSDFSRRDVIARAHEEDSNTSNNISIQTVIETRLSRRSLLRAGVGTAGSAVFGSLALAACGGDSSDTPVSSGTPVVPPVSYKLGFAPVDKNLLDQVTVPAGYTASVLFALGDPLGAGVPAFRNDGTDTDYANRAGDHHDGMEYFGLSATGTRDFNSSDRGLLAMNHEAITDQYLHATGTTANPRPAAESDKEIDAHGVSIVEIRKTVGKFSYVQDSALNRRITPLTLFEISGPVRGNALVKTKFSATGTQGRGTINNCGTGYTPWGTFLTGEENWAGYFTRSSTDDAARAGATAKSVVALNRYGRSQGGASRHGWQTSGSEDKYARFNISQIGTSADGTDDYRNELNTYGYIVEIDPYNKSAAIKKRTAMGRFAHESAVFGKVIAGKPLAAYQGDDSRGEYMYKFVSAANWSDADASATDRMSVGDKYLDSGKLYVAKFNPDGTGTWVELTIANATIANFASYQFADQADVLVNTRLAADAVGATRMDRPEWCAVHPGTGEIYYTLTNNSNRKLEPTSATQAVVDAANPRSYIDEPTATSSAGNVNGHIIRIRENGDESAATAFTWDVYLFGAQADADAARVNLSGLTTSQDFSSPDGLWFSRVSQFTYIQTDDGAYTDVTNCMMLIGVPGKVGDGAAATINYTKADGSTLAVPTRVGSKPTNDTLRRFLVGPVDCEITGCTETPDGKTLFVNIQHPGEAITKANITDPSKFISHWPANAGYGAGGAATARPRSATIVITKNDGGVIGT
jgi:uncharacterized protein